MLKIYEITHDTARDRLSSAIRRHIGPLMCHSVREAADVIDIDPRTLDSYRLGERLPALDTFLRLTMLPDAGPHIATAAMRMSSYEVRPLGHGCPCPWKINAELAVALGDLATMLADGRIDHTEDPVWQARAIEVGNRLISHANARKAMRQAAEAR